MFKFEGVRRQPEIVFKQCKSTTMENSTEDITTLETDTTTSGKDEQKIYQQI